MGLWIFLDREGEAGKLNKTGLLVPLLVAWPVSLPPAKIELLGRRGRLLGLESIMISTTSMNQILSSRSFALRMEVTARASNAATSAAQARVVADSLPSLSFEAHFQIPSPAGRCWFGFFKGSHCRKAIFTPRNV